MAQQVRALVAFIVDLGLVSSAHITCDYNVRDPGTKHAHSTHTAKHSYS